MWGPPRGDSPVPAGGGVRPEPPRVPDPLLLQRQPLFPERRRGQGVRAWPLGWVMGGQGGLPLFLRPQEGSGGLQSDPPAALSPPARSPGVTLDPDPVVAGTGPSVPAPQGPPGPTQFLRVVWGSQLPRGRSCGRGEPRAPCEPSQCPSQCSQYPPRPSSFPLPPHRSSRRSFGPTRSSSTCWGRAPRDPLTGELGAP